MGLLLPVLPAYVAGLGVSATGVGFLFTASALAGIVMSLATALLSAKFGGATVLVVAPAVIALASVWCGLADSFWTLAVFCVLEGLMGGAYATASIAAILADSSPERSGRSLAIYQGAALLGSAAGPAFGGWVGSAHVPALFFTNAGAASLIAFWLAMRLDREQRPSLPPDVEPARRPHSRLISPAWLSLWLFVFAVAFAQVGTQWVAAPFLGAGRLGLSPREIGIALALGGLAAFCALYPAGWLSDRYGRKAAIVGGGLGTAVALGVLVLSNTLAVFTAATVMLGVASALTGTAPAAHLAHALRGERLTIGVGLYRTATGLGSAVAPPFLGWWIARGDYSTALIAAAALLLVSGGAFALLATDIVGGSDVSAT